MKKLFPVIHAINEAQILQQAALCKEAGTDGIFLINQGASEFSHYGFINLIALAAQIQNWDEQWVGVNILEVDPCIVLPLLGYWKISGYWTDTADSWHVKQITNTWPMDMNRPNYYCSIDFKYQPKDSQTDIENEIKSSLENRGWGYNVVITTSGDKTGQPPSIEKIKRFREIAGQETLAIASGISLENIESFLPYADHFIVASSLEDKWGYFNPERVKKMADVVHSYKGD